METTPSITELLESIRKSTNGITLADLIALHPKVPRRTAQRWIRRMIDDGHIHNDLLLEIIQGIADFLAQLFIVRLHLNFQHGTIKERGRCGGFCCKKCEEPVYAYLFTEHRIKLEQV